MTGTEQAALAEWALDSDAPFKNSWEYHFEMMKMLEARCLAFRANQVPMDHDWMVQSMIDTAMSHVAVKKLMSPSP